MTNRRLMRARRKGLRGSDPLLLSARARARSNLRQLDQLWVHQMVYSTDQLDNLADDFRRGYLRINKRLMRSIKSPELKQLIVRQICLREVRAYAQAQEGES